MADPVTLGINDTDGDPLADAISGEGAGDFDVNELPDGSAVVSLPEDDEPYESSDFAENLAELLDDHTLDLMGSDIAELVESDRRSRKERDKQYAEGIKRTGLGDESPGGAEFEGASRAVHPMLAKGCVDFASRAIKELFPATGPCKTHIIGEVNDLKLDKAERKKSYMNWQLTTRIPEQRAEFENLLSQLPLGGSQYKRWWWDAALGRPRTEVVYVDDVFLPYSQSDFYSSYRVTHRQWVSADEFASRVASGLYRDLGLSITPPGVAEKSESKKASDTVEGNAEDDAAYNEEGQREIYQIYADLLVDDDVYADGRTAPYILHIENHTQRVLGLYRNWDEKDDSYAKKHWMVEYKFVPWRGAYGVGLYHLIGSLASSSTGALRALMDSAHISNFPGGLKLKGGRTSGQSISVNATELAEIDAPAGVDDIRKLVMPFPFNGPSPVLFNLLEWMTQQAEGVIATASESIADAGANMPVGTALALIEHGSTNFSAIHARCHASLKRELEILHRIDAEYMTDEETVEELGELVVTRQDFQGPMDIIPVSDPNIFSEAQRYAQAQAVMQLADNPGFAPFFKKDRLLQRVLRVLQIPGAEDLANLPKEPKRLGALDENYALMAPEPSPIKVYLEQDDLDHIKAHLTFLTSPLFGSSPMLAPLVAVPLMNHIKDHMVAMYKKHTAAAADSAYLTGQAMGQPMTRAQAEVQGAAFADKAMAKLLEPLMPTIVKAQQLAQQNAPKPPVDPTVQAQIAAQGQQAQMTAKAQQESQHATLMAQAQAAMAALNAKAVEADKEREFKYRIKQLELDYESRQAAAQADQNDRATVMATAIEKQSLEVQTQLAQFKADAETAAQQRAADYAERMQQLKAESDAQMLVLSETLKSQAASFQQEPIDVAGIVQPLVDEMQSNTMTMLEQLQAGLTSLQQAHQAPRVARYIKDEMGNNIGVESVPKGTMQ